MKKVVLYTRVSTDEQAEKGFSLRHQEDSLRRYCETKGYKIAGFFQDDYSAKTFERPEWKNLMSFVKANRSQVDTVLFTKWDRFSRNHGEALRVIQLLHKIGIEVNASEQPLDLQQPESKIILAVYLSVPEVENDKISLRTIDGLRRARKEGVWTASPPYGYLRHWTEDKKASLKPHPETAQFVQAAYELYSRNVYGIEELRKKLSQEGLKLSKNQFNAMLANPVYKGMIFLPAYKKEKDQMVKGLHEGLISEELWNRVDEIRTGKKRVITKSYIKNETLMLRQHVFCPECGHKLTGSASTSRNGSKHFYYHCNSPCKFRVKADDLNIAFLKSLASLTIPKEVAELYKEVLTDFYKTKGENRNAEIAEFEKEILKIEKTIESAEDRFFEGAIDKESFESAKARYTLKLEQKREQISGLKGIDAELKEQFQFSVYLLQNLDSLYINSTLEVKTWMIGSIYPEKLKIKISNSRTGNNKNEISLYGTLNGVLEGVKQWADPIKKSQPCQG